MTENSGKQFTFDKRLFVYLFFAFLVFAPLTTLTHEAGHYIAMKAQGFQYPRVHYTYTDTGRNEIREERRAIRARNKEALEKHIPFPEEERFLQLGRLRDSLWNSYKTRKFDTREAVMYAAGPLENILVGTIGILLLFLFRRNFRKAEKLDVKQWAIVFAAMCWFNAVEPLFGILYQRFIRGDRDMRTDDYKVSVHFGLYPWTINFIEGLLGILALWVLYQFIPSRQRCTLLIAFFSGIITGSVLWQCLLGPLLLP